ncbi:HD domain-containing protein [Dubosiella newyorkensis]|jgi:HD superfamily phosphohydrolase|nr:HD domain-containing protein [Dubosiella newyorkensis]
MKITDRLEEIKVMRDPIHSYIHIEYALLWKIIDTPEMQRLRRIHQLGGNFQVYHTAEHSRFSHSLGVYEIVRRMLSEIPSLVQEVSEQEKIVLMAASLVHDIGHGPFSHLFERITHKHHETMGKEILLDPSTGIYKLLVQYDQDLPDQIVSILERRHPKKILSQVLCSQLDADRMDYLLRDSYATGTSYGKFDLERILRTLRVEDGLLCVKESGVHSIEDYIMARYEMYWQVYLHPDAKSYDILILKLFERYEAIRSKRRIEALEAFYRPMDPQTFFKLDDYRFYTIVHDLQEDRDPYLSDLANRIMNRRLFDWVREPKQEMIDSIQEKLTRRKIPLSIYTHEERLLEDMYLPYTERKKEEEIHVLDACGKICPLSAKSEIVKALLGMETKTCKYFYWQKISEES